VSAAKKSWHRALVVAMMVARILAPQATLATARGLGPDPAATRLGTPLHGEAADADALDAAMAWRLRRHPRIAAALAARHLAEGTLVVCALTSTSCAGHTCPWAQGGHRRDGTKGKGQPVVGLGGHAAGCPVASEVCSGTTGAPTTLAPQRQNLRPQLHRQRLVLGGARGLRPDARRRDELPPVAGLDGMTALRGPSLQPLGAPGSLALSRFAATALLECTAPTSPQERLIACRNPLLAAERARQRAALLQAPEREWDTSGPAPTRPKRRLTGAAAMAVRGGQGRHRFKLGQHVQSTITATPLRDTRDTQSIAPAAALDGG
jgi:hypothetical protein